MEEQVRGGKMDGQMMVRKRRESLTHVYFN